MIQFAAMVKGYFERIRIKRGAMLARPEEQGLWHACDNGGRPGTYGNCGRSNKIDYVLLSPALFERVTAGGIDRRGVWGGKHGMLWPRLPEIGAAHQAASDHAAIRADLDV